MSPPIQKLSPELISQYPALATFTQYIRENGPVEPKPDNIVVTYENPNDGFVAFNYLSPNGQVFVARLNANDSLLELRNGKMVRNQSVWPSEISQVGVAKACDTLHALGGDNQAMASCEEVTPSKLFGQRAAWLGGSALSWWPVLEGVNWYTKKTSFTRAMIKNITTQLYAKNWTKVNRSLSGSLGIRLFSSALVDATLGKFFTEDPTARQGIRLGSFFLPDLYRVGMGNRTLALFERPGMKSFTRWGGRAMVAGFVADLAYMGYRYFHDGATARGQQNLLFQRANNLYNQNQDPLTSLIKGAADFIAPTLSQRFLVPGIYVRQARQEIKSETYQVVYEAKTFLRQFFDSQNLEINKGKEFTLLGMENTLKNFYTKSGKKLPLVLIADELNEPTTYAEHIQGHEEKEIISYLQNQFSGYRLTEAEAHEILARITLHRVRQQIAEMHQVTSPEDQPLLRFFDSEGKLLSGQEQALRDYLFS